MLGERKKQTKNLIPYDATNIDIAYRDDDDNNNTNIKNAVGYNIIKVASGEQKREPSSTTVR